MLDDEIIYNEALATARCCSVIFLYVETEKEEENTKSSIFFFFSLFGLSFWGFSVSSVGRSLIQSQIEEEIEMK